MYLHEFVLAFARACVCEGMRVFALVCLGLPAAACDCVRMSAFESVRANAYWCAYMCTSVRA